jgi:eukaryotic-like serine/threonine-protein kinase
MEYTDSTGMATETAPEPGWFGGKMPHMRDAFAGRLGGVALLFFLMYALGGVLDSLTHPEGRVWSNLWWFDIAAMALSLGLFVLTRMKVSQTTLLHAGLAFEVLGAFFIAVGDAFLFVDTGQRIHLIMWVCVWVAVFPLIVPAPPRQAIPAVLLAATMGPLSYGVRLAWGEPALSAPMLFAVYVPPYLAAGIALAPIFLMARFARTLKTAERMGSYELVDLLGQGGMGEVWRARHGMLARPAAIKLIKQESLSTSDREQIRKMVLRFEREAQTIARLRSPHTVVLYDYGVSPARTFYYVMELLDGIDLQSLVKKYGPVPPERAALFVRQACGSLAEAHHLGLVHRDIKPANLFTCRLGLDCDFLKVLDFGLVRPSEADAGQMVLTQEGAVAGTPAYMAPEALVDGRTVDGRADIYALGCVAYWLVTGHLVFEADSPLKMAVGHLHDEPVPPSKRTELEIPPAFERVILDCLAKDPAERIPTVQELDRRIAAVEWAAPWTRTRAVRWWEAHVPPPGPETPSGVDDGPTATGDLFEESR